MPRGEKNQAIGARYRQAILDLLKEGPKTRQQIMATLGMASASVSSHLRKLHQEPKQAFICDHIPNNQGMPAAVWALGDKPDVEYVPQSRPGKKISAEERRQQVLAKLREKPRSAKELAKVIYLSKKAAGIYITQLRAPENRQLFILKFLPPGVANPGLRASSWVPVYAVGNKPDAPAPKKETSSARHARLSKSEKYREAERRRGRLYTLIKKTRKNPRGIFSALGL
jgi:DNA-binding transcriptional ArsR family regulator